MPKGKRKVRRPSSPISLEDLAPRKDVRGSGQKQIFGILARDDAKTKAETDNK